MANHVALAAVDARKAPRVVTVLHERAGIVSKPACNGSRLATATYDTLVDAVTDVDSRMRTHAATKNAANGSARTRDVCLVNTVLNYNRFANDGLGKGSNATHTLLAGNLARLVYDEVADRGSATTQTTKETLKILRGAYLHIHDAMSLTVELAVELRDIVHPDRRVCHSSKVYVGNHLGLREDIVAALIDMRREPFHITRIGKQIPAVLQCRRLIGFRTICIGANALIVVVVCQSRCNHRKKKRKYRQNKTGNVIHNSVESFVSSAKISKKTKSHKAIQKETYKKEAAALNNSTAAPFIL